MLKQTILSVAAAMLLAGCVLHEEQPDFGDVGPCEGLALEEAPACYPDEVVFVAAGATGGTGTAAAPFGSFAEGLLAASARGADALAIAGDHELTASVELVQGVALLGGRDAQTWGAGSSPSKLTLNIEASEAVARGMVARNITAQTTVQDIRLEIPEAPVGRRAQIGAELVNAPGVQLVRVELAVGSGADGRSGIQGQAGSPGGEGGAGGLNGPRSGGLAGMTPMCAESAGSRGGTGGLAEQGMVTPPMSSPTTNAGVAGAAPGEDGQSGMIGGAGQPGQAGAPSTINGAGWILGEGAQPGESGQSGQGGSGGGGGLVVGGDGIGGGGGGGGAGGCGGQGGQGGEAGTDVVGLVVSGAPPELDNVQILVGTGGAGGLGGSGGPGGLGGKGGRFARGEGAGRVGGTGGDGGVGGRGGVGGAGQGGQVLGIVCSSAVALRQKNTRISIGEAGKSGDGSTTARAAQVFQCQ